MTLVLRLHRDSINIDCICGQVISLGEVREALLEKGSLKVIAEAVLMSFLINLKKNTLGAE